MSDTLDIRLDPRLAGRVAVITGAGSDIGLALALHAADRGMKVALADADRKLLTAVHEQVKDRKVDTLAVHADLTDPAAIADLARSTEAELGPPWLACNSAAATIDGNLWSVINGVQVFAPPMVMRGGGHIVNIASRVPFRVRGASADVAVWRAIVGLSESLYRELDSIRSPVGVTVVCPKPINTTLTFTFRDRLSASRLARGPGLYAAPPEMLAEQIFSAVASRQFWVFWQERDMRGTCGDFNTAVNCRAGIRHNAPAERRC